MVSVAGVTYSSVVRMLSMDAAERDCVAAVILVGQETPSGLDDWMAVGLGRVRHSKHLRRCVQTSEPNTCCGDSH